MCEPSKRLQHVSEEAIWLSSVYRISWSGLLARLVEAGLISEAEVRARPNLTRGAELCAFGNSPRRTWTKVISPALSRAEDCPPAATA